VSDVDLGGAQAPQTPGNAPAGASAEPPATQDPRVGQLEEQLAAAQAEAGRLKDEWLRARAETENVRRRATEDVAKAHRFGVEGFASELLAVKDSLDAALAVQSPSVDAYRQGVEITARQLDAALEKFSVKALNPQGEKFDPHRHQAISQVESDAEPNTVVTVLQKGYLLHDRVLRPALVVVSKGKSS
jgi:molecular chaperone GrpE